MIYNIHTPSKTFALNNKADESFAQLLERVLTKSGLSKEEVEGVKEKKSGAGVVYEFEGGRWSLEDEDDFQILQTRLPSSSTSSITLHLSPPHPHAHFAQPPSYTTPSSAIKTKSQNGNASSAKTQPHKASSVKPNSQLLAPPAPAGVPEKANGDKGKAKSFVSTKSRRSKWGDDDAEPLGEVIKREWTDFHNNIGVRTVMGKVGKTANVRMLLKSGYRHVYVSRTFALKAGLVPAKYGMGTSGYGGLKMLGNIPITVGSKTVSHPVYISEENHFDVVLGRSWIEKVGVKTDPLDQTALTYMDSGEAIPCDLVVLKDEKGNVITIT